MEFWLKFQNPETTWFEVPTWNNNFLIKKHDASKPSSESNFEWDASAVIYFNRGCAQSMVRSWKMDGGKLMRELLVSGKKNDDGTNNKTRRWINSGLM
jgi:hypothetical protein